MSQNALALEVRNVSAGYPGAPRAIDGLTFTMDAGERVALIGPNGAGKSTLFKAIAGLIPFRTGDISVYGNDCRSSHAAVGYVPQHNEIDWTFPATVTDVVMMGRAQHSRWFPWWRNDDHQRVQALLAELNLQSLADRPIGQLSGGQKRRVFIARALAQETQVLLMDEPFTGVDTSAESDIMETLDILTQRGITLLLSTHDMGRAARDFDRVLLLKNKVIAYGSAAEVMQADVLRQAYGRSLTVVTNDAETLLIADNHGMSV